MSFTSSCFGLTILRTAFFIGKALETGFSESNLAITLHQYIFLSLLQENDQMIQQDVADFMKKDKSAVLRTIDLLEQKNWVSRSNDSQDRRKRKLKVTQEGTELLLKAQEIEEKILADLQSSLTKQEMATFLKVALQLQESS